MPHHIQATTTTTDPIQYQCRHIRPDGHRCGSPSLRAQNFCFYHDRARRPGPRQPQITTTTARKASTFDLPSPADLADRAGIQLAVALLLHKIAHNEIDPRRAGLLLYGLQTAAMLLPKEPKSSGKRGRTFSGGPSAANQAPLEAGPVEDITEDPIHGPIAPACELGDNEPESTLARWAREMRESATPEELAQHTAAKAAANEAKTATANEAKTAPTPHPPTFSADGTYIPPSYLVLNAAATPTTPRPNRACRRQTAKQKRHQKTQTAERDSKS